MLEQAVDFRDESEALYQLVAGVEEEQYGRATLFKGWTIDRVIGHLHHWNWAAHLSLTDPDGFQAWAGEALPRMAEKGMIGVEEELLGELAGRELLETWRSFYLDMAAVFEAADPRQRVRWAGPDMSVRSSITARLMETWSHGQAVYDMLGVDRQDSDRIRNIAQLGVNTFGWTFANRREEPSGPVPRVSLRAPSGATWEWNADNSSDSVEGDATEFCQVVAQTRNIADTGLRVQGPVAQRWMEVAQCFAGPVETPPAPGVRHRAH